MRLKIISTFLIALLMGGVAAGQNTSWVRRKISGTVHCDKPSDQQSFEVGDRRQVDLHRRNRQIQRHQGERNAQVPGQGGRQQRLRDRGRI